MAKTAGAHLIPNLTLNPLPLPFRGEPHSLWPKQRELCRSGVSAALGVLTPAAAHTP